MVTDERKDEILDLLKSNGRVRVTDLSRRFGVSEVTIRTDLSDLERKGLLSRVHGGAISLYKPYYSMNMTQRLETNQTEKVNIAEKIAQMIEPDDTIMMNSGTTTLLTFRKFPSEYSLNIITNSVAIALEAASNPNYNVVLIGGSLNTRYQFTFGTDAVGQLRNYHADKFVLSVDGIDADNGFTTYYDKEAEIDRVMMAQSYKCIVAADFSKFHHSAFVKISDLSVADCIVTNSSIDPEVIAEFKELGVDVRS